MYILMVAYNSWVNGWVVAVTLALILTALSYFVV